MHSNAIHGAILIRLTIEEIRARQNVYEMIKNISFLINWTRQKKEDFDEEICITQHFSYLSPFYLRSILLLLLKMLRINVN